MSRADTRRKENIQSGQEQAMAVFFARRELRAHVEKLARRWGPDVVQELVDQALLGPRNEVEIS